MVYMVTPNSKEQLEILLRLGFSKVQATLYLTSLRCGVLSVLELSKITKINRQQIYSEAEELVDLGIYELTRKQGRKYIPANPDKLIKIGKKRINETENVLTELSIILPHFEALSTQKKNKVVVKYFEGMSKIKEAYEEELDASKNTEVLSLAGSIDNIFEFLPESYWDKWNIKFVKYKSTSRMLVHNSEAARRTIKNDKQYKRETRWIEKFPLQVNIDVFNNTVLIVSFHDGIAIWIESHMLAQSYRIMFNTLWELSKPFK